MLTSSNKVLVVMPALNEACSIAEVLAGVRAHCAYDILVVDDSSVDATAEIARAGGARVLSLAYGLGAWGAIQTGIRYALRKGYVAVVTMDADGQHRPEALPEVVRPLLEGDANVVVGGCIERGSRLRHLAWKFFKLLSDISIDDLTSGFRAYDLRAMHCLVENGLLLDYQDIGVLLMLRQAGLKKVEVPVAMESRRHGISRIFNSWYLVFRYMVNTSLLCVARKTRRGHGVRSNDLRAPSDI